MGQLLVGVVRESLFEEVTYADIQRRQPYKDLGKSIQGKRNLKYKGTDDWHVPETEKTHCGRNSE